MQIPLTYIHCLWKWWENTESNQNPPFIHQAANDKGHWECLWTSEEDKAFFQLRWREKIRCVWTGEGMIVFSMWQEGLGKLFISLYHYRNRLCLCMYLWHWKRQRRGFISYFFCLDIGKGQIIFFCLFCGRGWREVCLCIYQLLGKE